MRLSDEVKVALHAVLWLCALGFSIHLCTAVLHKGIPVDDFTNDFYGARQANSDLSILGPFVAVPVALLNCVNAAYRWRYERWKRRNIGIPNPMRSCD
jgi:hypothetical protein